MSDSGVTEGKKDDGEGNRADTDVMTDNQELLSLQLRNQWAAADDYEFNRGPHVESVYHTTSVHLVSALITCCFPRQYCTYISTFADGSNALLGDSWHRESFDGETRLSMSRANEHPT